MGLTILTPFSTPEGFQLNTLYCRIVSFTYNVIGQTVTIEHVFYIDRDKRTQGYSPIPFPKISQIYSYTGHSTMPSMVDMYALTRATILRLGFEVQDIFEDGQEVIVHEPVVVEPLPSTETPPKDVDGPTGTSL